MSTLSRLTEPFLVQAGLAPGMRVLDLGCGRGEVTRAVARLVGPGGAVVALDVNPANLAEARAAVHAEGLTNVTFHEADLAEPDLPPASFDAIVGRRVLMYVPELPRVLAGLVALLRDGGVMALQEHDATMTPARRGHWPVHDKVHEWIWRTVRHEGADPHLGFALPGLLTRAGLTVEAVEARAIVAGFEEGLHHPFHTIIEAIAPRIVAAGLASVEELDLATLADRLAAERLAHDSIYVSDMAFCVVARRRSPA